MLLSCLAQWYSFLDIYSPSENNSNFWVDLCKGEENPLLWNHPFNPDQIGTQPKRTAFWLKDVTLATHLILYNSTKDLMLSLFHR